jgi:hypothetical protein
MLCKEHHEISYANGKNSLPYVIACNSMSNIYHVTQVRFAASVPEGKSRTSVLKSSFTLSGGIIQQQLPDSSIVSSLGSPTIYPL